MKNGEKLKKIAEEIISHEMMRKDEMEKENEQLVQVINQEEIQTQNIINKRMQTKYSIKYIQFFSKFEDIFLQNTVKE